MVKLAPARLAISVLLALAAPAAAQDRPDLRNLARFKYRPTPEELERLLHDAWYGVYLNEAKVGYGQVTFLRTADGYEATSSVKMQFVRSGTTQEIVVRSRLVFDLTSPYALRAGFHRKRCNEVVVETRARREAPGRFQVTTRQQGGTQVRTVDRVDFNLTDHVAQVIWARERPVQGSELTTLRLDVESWRLGAARMRVEASREAQQRVALLGAQGEKVGQLTLDAQGLTARETFPGGVELRLEPRTAAKELDEAIDILEATAAPVDRELGDPARVVRLRLQVGGPDRGRLPDATLQRVTKHPDGRVFLEVDTRAERTPATRDELRRCLEATPELAHQDPRVQAFARDATRGAATPWEKVKQLVRAVHRHIEYDLNRNAFTALQVLEARRGDCSEYALLTAAACRAVGVPARGVSGLGYAGDEERAFGGHAWTEVVIDGRWVPVDACWDQAPADATHIRLSELGTWAPSRVKFRALEVDRR